MSAADGQEASTRFGAVPTRAVRDPEVSDAELRVLAELATFADVDGWCFPNQRTMGAHLGGKSRQAVSKQLQSLVAKGYVEIRSQHRQDGSRRGNLYRVVLDTPVTPATSEVAGGATPQVAGDATSEVAAVTHHENRPSDTAPTAQQPNLLGEVVPTPKKSTSRDPVKIAADRIARAWWEATTPRPLLRGGFVAARGIVEQALRAGWPEEKIARALPRVDGTLVLWKLSEQLEKLRPEQDEVDEFAGMHNRRGGTTT